MRDYSILEDKIYSTWNDFLDIFIPDCEEHKNYPLNIYKFWSAYKKKTSSMELEYEDIENGYRFYKEQVKLVNPSVSTMIEDVPEYGEEGSWADIEHYPDDDEWFETDVIEWG